MEESWEIAVTRSGSWCDPLRSFMGSMVHYSRLFAEEFFQVRKPFGVCEINL